MRGRSAAKATPAKTQRQVAGDGGDPFASREAERYERPIPSREAILALLEARGEMLTEARIAEALQLVEERDLFALHKRLGAMLRDGQLLQGRRGGLAPVQKLDLLTGVVIANTEGYGFFRPEDGGDDLYLSPQQMRTVLHGDRVLASVVGLDRRGRRQGAVVEVLERRVSRIVGRVSIEDGVVLVIPDDRRICQNLLVADGQAEGASHGQIVVAEITSPPTQSRGPIGRIVAVLGARLQPSLLVEMAIASHDLPHEWPALALAEAAKVSPTVTAAEREGRVDLRDTPLVTIDGEDARDFDDAVYAVPRRGGGYKLIVAIADVSHYVPIGSALDAEAYERSTSTYFPGFVVPMLPETLSNGICSLNPDVERLCMVCEMTVDADGEVSKSKFYQAVMRSHARLTYNKVWQAVGLQNADAREEVADVLPQLEHLHALYKLLAAQRRRRGAIDFESHEVKFRLDGQGEVVSMGATERNDAHKLIEECMIAANVQAAMYLEKKGVPALYRAHLPPPEEKYEEVRKFLREFKIRMPSAAEVTPADFARVIQEIRDRPERELIQSVLLRSQSMATYQPSNHGHFGLSLEAYAHFTSPIRRYPDLLVHRAIRHALTRRKASSYSYNAERMEDMALHCSQRERRAEEAERDVTERFKCAWMEKHVGSEFDGVVTGVTSFGLFVELDASRVSGLIHISQLSNDYYHFDPARHSLTGEHSGQIFRLGDRLRIQVLRASLEDRKIDFRLVAEAGKAATKSKQAGKSGKSGKSGKPIHQPVVRASTIPVLPELPPLPSYVVKAQAPEAARKSGKRSAESAPPIGEPVKKSGGKARRSRKKGKSKS